VKLIFDLNKTLPERQEKQSRALKEIRNPGTEVINRCIILSRGPEVESEGEEEE